MKSIGFRLMIAALAVLLGSAIASSQTADNAQPAPPVHGHALARRGYMMAGHTMGFYARHLNLTDDQKTEMKAVLQKERPGMRPLMQQEHQIDLQLHELAEGTFDVAKVQALATQKAQIQVQLTVAQTRIHNELYKVLTSEQQSQLKELEANREARMQKRMQQAPSAPPAE